MMTSPALAHGAPAIVNNLGKSSESPGFTGFTAPFDLTVQATSRIMRVEVQLDLSPLIWQLQTTDRFPIDWKQAYCEILGRLLGVIGKLFTMDFRTFTGEALRTIRESGASKFVPKCFGNPM
jgi:hypothetical protein